MGRLDESIDRAVREILDVEPPRDLVRRVIGELGEARPRRLRAAWMIPAGAAALVILAVALTPLLRPRTVSGPPQSAATMERPVAPPSAPPSDVSVRPLALTHQRESVSRREVATAIPAEAPAGTIVLNPLAPLEPIPLAPVRTASVAITPVDVPPLAALVPIDLEPLSPTRDRD